MRRFINAKCRQCGKTGHIASVCGSKVTGKVTSQHNKFCKKPDKVKTIDATSQSIPLSDEGSTEATYSMFSVISRSKPIMLMVKVNHQDIKMELDTGASVSVISDTTFKSLFEDTVSILLILFYAVI